jgi:hypothetical protein
MPARPKPLCAAKPCVLSERDEAPRNPKHLGSGQREVRDPSWAQVEAAIRRLDNSRFTDLSLDFAEGRDRTSLLVSGGNEGRVVCCVARAEDPDWGQDFRHLVDLEWRDADDEFEQVIGGQASALPAKLSVPRETALRAARYFFEHRALDPGLRWQVP